MAPPLPPSALQLAGWGPRFQQLMCKAESSLSLPLAVAPAAAVELAGGVLMEDFTHDPAEGLFYARREVPKHPSCFYHQGLPFPIYA